MDRTTIVFDLTRTTPSNLTLDSLFSTIESIKNGIFFNPKYESGECIGPPPHVVIFSNCLPPNLANLSKDRWKIRRIRNKDKSLIKVTTKEMIRFIQEYQRYEMRVHAKKMKEKKELRNAYEQLHPLRSLARLSLFLPFGCCVAINQRL
jgi:hypothetical protein